MGLKFILGRSGYGKTQFCINEIIQKSKLEQDKNLILLVPEQFTFQSQKDLIEKNGNKGVYNAEVLSFERMYYKILDEIGRRNKNTLGDIGKDLIVCKTIQNNQSQLTIFKDATEKKGMIQFLSDTMKSFYQYCIDIDDLKQKLNLIENNEWLKYKLQDLIKIYENFKENIKERYEVMEENLDILSKNIQQSNWLENTEIWIDGFHGFTNQEYKVINELLKKVKSINITLTMDNIEKNINKSIDLFLESKKTFQKLEELAKINSIQIEKIICVQDEKVCRFKDSKTLAKLEKSIFRVNKKINVANEEENNDIQIYSSSNRYEEINYVAKNILELVRESNYKYEDIAVVCRNLEDYKMIIQKVFNDYNIDYFIDQKEEIFSHPIVQLVISVFDIITKRWSYESVFSYIKTSLVGITIEQSDKIENYVLKYGIKGEKKYTEKDWEYPVSENSEIDENVQLEEINSIRKIIVEPIHNFHKQISKDKCTIAHITISLYELLQNIHIEESLNIQIQKYQSQQKLVLAKKIIHVYNILMEVLDKMVEIMGDEEVTISQYVDLLEAGFEKSKMTIAPLSTHQVMIGDMERSRIPEIKALFVIGVNDGIIPKKQDETTIFSDEEKKYLQNINLEFFKNGEQKLIEEQFLIYLGLTKPKNKLYISYSLSDQEGKTLRPSMVINQIKQIFPRLKEINEQDIYCSELDYITTDKVAIRHFGNYLDDLIQNNKISMVWRNVYDWYYNKEHWKQKINILEKALFYTNQESYINQDSISRIYGNNIYCSASQIERFALCPFSYFLQYGLRVKERKIYQLQNVDIGQFFHQSIDRYFKLIKDKDISIRTIDREQNEVLVEEVVKSGIEELNYNILKSSYKNTYLIQRLKRIMNKTVWNVLEHIKKGNFEPAYFEMAFGKNGTLLPIIIELDDERKISINGKIDRVDIFEQEDKIYVKIIDYKSGTKTFRLEDIYDGLQLQLILYLEVLLKNYTQILKDKTKTVIPAGMFYFKMDDPIINTNPTIEDRELEDILFKYFKMTGIALKDGELIKQMDGTTEGYSSTMPVQITKTGDFSKRSSVASIEEFKQYSDIIYSIIKQIGKELLDGNIKIYPYKNKTKTACDFCNYNSVCLFDSSLSNNTYRTCKILSE